MMTSFKGIFSEKRASCPSIWTWTCKKKKQKKPQQSTILSESLVTDRKLFGKPVQQAFTRSTICGLPHLVQPLTSDGVVLIYKSFMFYKVHPEFVNTESC
jgi:hypothetical protein